MPSATRATPPDHTTSTPQPLRGAWLYAARAVWLAVAGIVLGMYTLGLPARIHYLVLVSPFNKTNQLSPAHLEVLARLGIAPSLYYGAMLTVELALALACLAVAALVFWRRADSVPAILFSILIIALGCTESPFTSALANQTVLLFQLRKALQIIALALGVIVLYIFPDGRFTPRWTRASALIWGTLLALWLLFPALPYSPLPGGNANPTSILSTCVLLGWLSTGAIALVLRYRHTVDLRQRQQMKWAVVGLVAAFGLALLNYLSGAIINGLHLRDDPAGELLYNCLQGPLYWIGLAIIPPFFFAPAILRHRLWDIDPIINRVLVYGGLTAVLASIYAISVIAIGAVLRALTGQGSAIAIAGATLLITAAFRPLRDRLQSAIDRRFFRARIDLRAAVAAFGRDIRAQIHTPGLLRFIVAHGAGLLHSEHAVVFLRDGQGGLTLAATEPLDGTDIPPVQLRANERARLDQGAALTRPSQAYFQLLLPLSDPRSAEGNVLGVLALGARRSGQPYSTEDRALMLRVAEHAGTALAVAQLVAAERQLEDFRAAPAGRAEAVAKAILAHPESAFVQIDRLTRQATTNDTAAVLAALPQALRERRVLQLRPAALLAQGYHYLLAAADSPELLGIGLRDLLAALDDPGAADWQAAPDARAWYRDCQEALQAATIEAMIIWARTAQRDQRPAGEPISTIAGLSPVLDQLRLVAGRLAIVPSDSSDERLIALLQAQTRLGESSRAWPANAALHQRLIVSRIMAGWRATLAQAIRAVRGQARLELRLITHAIAPAERAIVALELHNAGLGPAEQVIVTLKPHPTFQLLTDQIAITHIGPGQRATLAFEIVPMAALLPLNLWATFDDATEAGQAQAATFAVNILNVPSYVAAIPNVYQPGTPLAANSATFFGRDQQIQALHDAFRPPGPARTLVLTGSQRMGKTSLLQQLGQRLDPSLVSVYLDLQGLAIDPGMGLFFAGLASPIARALGIAEPDPAEFGNQPATVFAHIWLPQALEQLGERRLLLLIDEFEELEARVVRGKLDIEIFAYFRHLMQHEPRVGLVFAGMHPLNELSPAYWSTFFNAALHQRIGGLPEAAARALITNPVAGRLLYDDLALDRMLRLTGGHPFFLQLLCHTLVEQANRDRRTIVTAAHVRVAVEQALLLAEAHLISLWHELADAERRALTVFAGQAAAITVQQVTQMLEVDGTPLARSALEAALRRLVQRDLLEFDQGGYAWKLELMGQWLQRGVV